MTTDQKPALDSGEAVKITLAYHERTKHSYDYFAPSLGYLDWSTQPNPFRRYEGASLISLSLPNQDQTPPYHQIFQPESIKSKPVDLSTLSEFFYYSLSISAWKQYGPSRWALRVNPSSGNLHPTEGYLVCPAIEGLHHCPAVYHYSPLEHGLERRTEFSEALWADLTPGLPRSAFFVGISSIYWRESWKYGERAYRYCQHDAGHALAALRISAALFGWRLYFLDRVSDNEVNTLLGLNQNKDVHPLEQESPTMMMVILPDGQVTPDVMQLSLPEEPLRSIEKGRWLGKANKLSHGHHEWEVINEVSHACWKPKRAKMPSHSPHTGTNHFPHPTQKMGVSAGKIIRQRRSVLAMDGKTSMTRNQFYHILSRIVPQINPMPWDSISWSGFVHMGIFVHRVMGLQPGLYVLARDEGKLTSLKEQMNSDFLWQKPHETPDRLLLYFLMEGDVRRLAARVSCNQDIAGDSAFSLGMLAGFEPALSRNGAHFYRNLFWETGMIGQVLYLETEAIGLRSTGIGCFFDDPVHAAFGLKNGTFQSLYHFTVGGHVEDPRLTSLPAYFHLGDNKKF